MGRGVGVRGKKYKGDLVVLGIMCAGAALVDISIV